jgi:hypothetical protein
MVILILPFIIHHNISIHNISIHNISIHNISIHNISIHNIVPVRYQNNNHSFYLLNI